MTHPTIGLTTTTATMSGQIGTKIMNTYIQAVLDAGGIPLLIPNDIPDEHLREMIQQLNGLLLTGGGDIHPDRYGSHVHARISNIYPERDRTEFTLLEAAITTSMPFLGICRGFQVINVALGGTLYEDISDQHPDARKHDYYPDWPRDYLAHEVEVNPDSQMGHVLDQQNIRVNSLHHQAVRRISSELLVTARAPDGIVERLELSGHPFGLGVQWHPECLQAYAPMRALFQASIGAANQFRTQYSGISKWSLSKP